MEATMLNPAQIMILESFASAKSQEEMDELMDMLRNFYAMKLDKELERLWDEGILNQEKLDELKEQHLLHHIDHYEKRVSVQKWRID